MCPFTKDWGPLIKSINAQQNMYSIQKKIPSGIRFQKITRIRIQIIFGLKNDTNKNTNNIRFEKIAQLRILITFGFKKSPEYKYNYQYSASSIRIIFEYRIIRSPLTPPHYLGAEKVLQKVRIFPTKQPKWAKISHSICQEVHQV